MMHKKQYDAGQYTHLNYFQSFMSQCFLLSDEFLKKISIVLGQFFVKIPYGNLFHKEPLKNNLDKKKKEKKNTQQGGRFLTHGKQQNSDGVLIFMRRGELNNRKNAYSLLWGVGRKGVGEAEGGRGRGWGERGRGGGGKLSSLLVNETDSNSLVFSLHPKNI